MTARDVRATDETSLIYAVCVGRAGTLAHLSGAGFEPDQRLEVLTHGGLDAVVVRLPIGYLVGEDAEKRLADPQWLTPRAMRHEEIIREARERAEVMPLTLGVVFREEMSLAQKMADHSTEILGFLGRVAQRDEWSLKVMLDPTIALRTITERLIQAETQGKAVGPGAKYFLEKKAASRAGVELRRREVELAQSIETLLRERWGEVVVRRATRDDSGLSPIGHWALLVGREQSADLEALSALVRERAGEPGLSVAWTGPWAPYSFCPRLAA
ncbi:MAG: GvpL/GvpF family gas vesicle protein [Planctomycetota bacterium]|nr:GvpL/GvpF family gas vesicle protein [Planctomycetota bacterium]